MRGGDDDPLSTRVGLAQDGEILGRDWHQCSQLFWREMLQPKQFAEIPGRHAKDLPCLRLQLRPRGLQSEHLSEVGDNVLPVDRRQPDPDVTGPIGDAVAHPVREPGDDARDDLGDPDGESVAKLPWALAPVAFAGAAQDALHLRIDRRCRVVVLGRGRYWYNCHSWI
ncbi:MAG: hypothetical protein K0R68_2622, partial [Mycobacterium sp.]|nr:hypothetical protein [Mycobacterium sp.]